MSSYIYYECRKCGTYLPEETALNDSFKCPACGSKMVETAAREMQDEVNKSYNKYKSCTTCGGYFPSSELLNGNLCPIDRKLTVMIVRNSGSLL